MSKTDETREALEREIFSYAAQHPTERSSDDWATALTAHEQAIKAEALYWAARKLREGIWPEGEEQGVENAARELEARAHAMGARPPMSDALNALPIGYIHIDYALDDRGEPVTGVEVEGEIPLVTQLGLLRMAEDSILSGEFDDE